jgi:DNA-directed RNA polymerase subunit beta
MPPGKGDTRMTSFASTLMGLRKDFTKIPVLLQVPDLIQVQRESFRQFLQLDVPMQKRGVTGLQSVFDTVFPIENYKGTARLEFVSYQISDPKCSIEEAQEKGINFAAPIKARLRLRILEPGEGGAPGRVRDIREQEVYLGDLPLMTPQGTFVINGVERVIVSQMQRSPGVVFSKDKSRLQASGKTMFTGQIIPSRGSWVDFEFDAKDILYVRIDRRRRFPATVFLKALGMTTGDILRTFYPEEEITFSKGEVFRKLNPDLLLGTKAGQDFVHPKTGEVLQRAGYRISQRAIGRLQEAGIDRLQIDEKYLVGKVSSRDIYSAETGEIYLEENEAVTPEAIERLREAKIKELHLLFIDNHRRDETVRKTLLVDKALSQDDALKEIYSLMRGDRVTMEAARNYFASLFSDARRYDLAPVGRLKINSRLGIDHPLEQNLLTREDVIGTVTYLLDLKMGFGDIDDIDHLGNRRVRSVGELLENQFRIGLVRMERAIREKMSVQELEESYPQDLINAKPIMAAIKEFFGSSQLSQFMDQTNPLSEVTHKRRLSALGPGGLTRERAGFEVRDVHTSHYGRICPIETPEGPNIGLIVSLSTYARINDYGFIETPYRKVVNGRVTEDIHYLSALEEDKHTIAQANAQLDAKGKFVSDRISARQAGEFSTSGPADIQYMDVSPKQLVSVSASLIPFLEHDDANRALMGSNMQRQAVPLIQPEAPLVGTGMEGRTARDSGVLLIARRGGTVEKCDAQRIVIRVEEKGEPTGDVDIYTLIKFRRSNQATCINQRSLVRVGDRVKAGQVLADGPSTDEGELAMGRNVLVAYMPWEGYNFEDAILVSEKLVREDVFTSIHIEEFECEARETKIGAEEITRDIPNQREEALGNLDESGIIRIGAEVRPHDTLVGKVTPKEEPQLSPEERLLRAIFGEKAREVKDTSLRAPAGVEGVVVDVKVLSRRGVEKDERTKTIESKEISRLEKDYRDEREIATKEISRKAAALLKGETCNAKVIDPESGEVLLKKKEKITEEALAELSVKNLLREMLPGIREEVRGDLERLIERSEEQLGLLKVVFEDKINRLKRGDELPPGVLKVVKVYVAMKRKLSVGDKMAGRHGNKGVISKVLAEEDMPFLEDGTPVEIVLNPLGVPSRMNIGQILETHLGWASAGLGAKLGRMVEEEVSSEKIREWIARIYGSDRISATLKRFNKEELLDTARAIAKRGVRMATSVFEGASEEEIKALLAEAELPVSGKTTLFDGRTGESFRQKITVGYIYMLKLHHLVDDKIHARSTGPYSLVTQQPLGGKAQFGGQRFGEMEVWALEAYGAAAVLQEMLTVKSDDVIGRTKMYESIVKGDCRLMPSLPESFNVLIKELQSLALDVELVERKK